MTIPVPDGYVDLHEPAASLWRAAANGDDLTALTKEYLAGKLGCLPWVMRSLDEDLIYFRRWLTQITDHGFTFVDAQPGALGFQDHKQRAVIRGFVASNVAGILSEELRRDGRYLWTNSQHYGKGKWFTYPVSVTASGLTIARAAKTTELKPLTEYTYAGFLNPDLEARLDDDFVHFQVTDHVWGANDLFPGLIRILKDAAL